MTPLRAFGEASSSPTRPPTWVYSLEGIAAVAAATQEDERAATLLGASRAVAEASGALLEPFEREIHERTMDAAADALGAEAFASAFTSGRQFTPAAAVAFALGERGARLTA